VPALLTRSAPSLSGGGAACGPLRRRPPSLPAPRRQLLPLLPGGRPLLCGRLRRRQLLLLLPGRLEARGGKSPASSLSGPKLVPARPHCCTSSGDSGMAGYSASSSLRIRDPTQAPELHVGAVYWPSVARRAHPGILSAFSCTVIYDIQLSPTVSSIFSHLRFMDFGGFSLQRFFLSGMRFMDMGGCA
jgi:hypothetical protein